MLETSCIICGQRYRLGTDHVCPKVERAAKKSTGSAESRRAGQIKGTGTRPDGMGPLGEVRHRNKIRATGDRNRVEESQKIAVALSSFGPADSPPAGLAPGSVDTKRGPGRPRTITDMKAYRLQKQRERRAAQKKNRDG